MKTTLSAFIVTFGFTFMDRRSPINQRTQTTPSKLQMHSPDYRPRVPRPGRPQNRLRSKGTHRLSPSPHRGRFVAPMTPEKKKKKRNDGAQLRTYQFGGGFWGRLDRPFHAQGWLLYLKAPVDNLFASLKDRKEMSELSTHPQMWLWKVEEFTTSRVAPFADWADS